jgi:CRISPR-associated protein Csm3
MVLKFNKNIVITGKIKLITGMHIGGLTDSIKIGGVDSPVITIRVLGDDKEIPYIPGSSLKGKMRRLLSNVYDAKYKNGIIEKVFGSKNEAEGKNNTENITRAIFRDAYLDSNRSLDDVTEIKGENTIDPVTSKANPRFIQRVIPGSEFNYEIVLTVYEGDNERDMVELIEEGFKLLKDSYIGGHGTRGYGRIDYTIDTIDDQRDKGFYERSVNEKKERDSD